MKNYKPLGKYIQLVVGRNNNLGDLPLMGLSIQKKFIPSIANTIGTDMSTYRIIEKNQFAYGPVTSRNGDKITIALFNEYDKALISQAYIPFEVKDTDELDPEYLMMWFRRPEFDRYARFKSHGSAREIFDWEEMCNILLPVPHITKQREIIKEYNTIQNRINLNNQLIQKLEETAQTIYKHWFVDFEFPDENGKPYKSSGGEMINNKEMGGLIPKGWEIKKLADISEIKGGKRLQKGHELNGVKNGRPYIKVFDMCNSKYLVLNDKFQYVDDKTQKSIAKYIVSKNDIIISIVGTIGLINVIDVSLENANLTENCVRITKLKKTSSDYIYHFLFSKEGQNIFETKTVGGVQGKLPLYNIQTIPILYPNDTTFIGFEMMLKGLNTHLKNISKQNIKLTNLNEILLSKLSTIEN